MNIARHMEAVFIAAIASTCAQRKKSTLINKHNLLECRTACW